MLQDKIIARQIEKGFPVQERIVFRLDFSYYDLAKFGSHQIDFEDLDWNSLSLSSRLPFESIAINAVDAVLWAEEAPVDHVTNRIYMQFWIWQKEARIFGSTALSMNLNITSLSTFDFTHDQSGAPPKPKSKLSENDDPALRSRAITMFAALEGFLQLLGSTQITSVYHEPPPKIQKKREKRNKPPLSSWYTLMINPGKLNLSKIQSDQSIELNRLHLCRGHMTEYGANGKGLLFGKYAGRFWISPHLRGSPKRGTIKKDYKL